MDIYNDPIGTKYGCTIHYEVSYYSFRLTPLSAKTYEDDECYKRYASQPIDYRTFKPQWRGGKHWVLGDGNTLRFENTFNLKIEQTNDLGDDYIEEITEEIDANDYTAIAGLTLNRVTAIPRDQLFISEPIYLTYHQKQNIDHLYLNSGTNVTVYGAVSIDKKTWYAYNDTSKKLEIIDFDITKDAETLKKIMTNSTLYCGSSYYDKVFKAPVDKIYIALLVIIYNKTVPTTTNLGTLNLFTTQMTSNANKRFNFVKVGYTPTNGVKLIADRNILTTNPSTICAYWINGSHNRDFAQLDRNMSTLTYDVYPKLICSKLNKTDTTHDEWKDLIEFTETNGLSIKDFWHIDDIPTYTYGLAIDNVGKNGDIFISRGTPENLDEFFTYDNGKLVGFRPVIEVRKSRYEEYIPGKPQLPEVTNIKDIKKGTCISCDFLSNIDNYVVGTFSNLGKATMPLYSDGPRHLWNTNDIRIEPGSFYFICIGYTNRGEPILVPDRPLASNAPGTIYNCGGSNMSYAIDTYGTRDYNNPCREYRLYTMDGIAVKIRNIMSNVTVGIDRNNVFDEYERIFTNELIPSLKPEEIWHHDKTYTITRCACVTPNINYPTSVYRDHHNAFYMPSYFTDWDYVGKPVHKYMGWRPIIIIDKTPRLVSSKIDRNMIRFYDTEFNVDLEVVDENFEPIEFALKLYWNPSKYTLSDYSMDRVRKIEVTNEIKDKCYYGSQYGLFLIAIYVKINNEETPISCFLMQLDNAYKNKHAYSFMYMLGYNYEGIEFNGAYIAPYRYDAFINKVYTGPVKEEYKVAHGHKYIDIKEDTFKVMI